MQRKVVNQWALICMYVCDGGPGQHPDNSPDCICTLPPKPHARGPSSDDDGFMGAVSWVTITAYADLLHSSLQDLHADTTMGACIAELVVGAAVRPAGL